MQSLLLSVETLDLLISHPVSRSSFVGVSQSAHSVSLAAKLVFLSMAKNPGVKGGEETDDVTDSKEEDHSLKGPELLNGMDGEPFKKRVE